MALSVLAALYHRDRTGEGQWIDASQTEAGIMLTQMPVLDWSANGRSWERTGNRAAYAQIAPQGIYRCADDDRWIAVTCATEAHWQALASAAEHRTRKALEEHRERKTARRVGGTLVTPEDRRRWRQKHRMTRYGITSEQFDWLLEVQGYCCAMGGEPFTEDTVICIDHDHECCRARGGRAASAFAAAMHRVQPCPRDH